ncbi:MAG: recombinase family protein, partial [Chloroflexota bacterium]|nr:recombinase family protein [Chloroflexota bacterium]
RAGVELLFVTEEFEKTAVGKIIRSVKSFAAELEREKIRERTARGREAKLRGGRLAGNARPPYGYRYRDEAKAAFVPDEATAPTVRRIFALAAGGASLRSIALRLTDEGIPSPKGLATWEPATVKYILHHTAYIGDLRAHRWGTARQKGKAVNVRRPEADHIPLPEGVCPPLIDRATFEAVQAKLARNKAEATRNAKAPERFLLRGGYARCGCCGRALTAAVGKGDHAVYKANTIRAAHHAAGRFGISATLLDGAVWARVRALLTDPATVAAEVARHREDDGAEADLAAVDSALAAVAKQQANLATAVAMLDDADAAAPLVAQIKALGERKRALAGERAGILARRADWQAAQDRLRALEDWCRVVAANVDDLTYAERREMLAALGVQVRVWPSGHAPRYEIRAVIPFAAGEQGDIVGSGTRCPTTPGCATASPRRTTHAPTASTAGPRPPTNRWGSSTPPAAWGASWR